GGGRPVRSQQAGGGAYRGGGEGRDGGLFADGGTGGGFVEGKAKVAVDTERQAAHQEHALVPEAVADAADILGGPEGQQGLQAGAVDAEPGKTAARFPRAETLDIRQQLVQQCLLEAEGGGELGGQQQGAFGEQWHGRYFNRLHVTPGSQAGGVLL